MTNTNIEDFRNFRNHLFGLFKYRADSTFDLIDAIAGQNTKESSVKLSLSNLFRRSYSSITDAVDNLFRRMPKGVPNLQEMAEDQLKITQLFAKACSQPHSRPFALFAVDCSSNPRIYSEKLEDRGYVHQPMYDAV